MSTDLPDIERIQTIDLGPNDHLLITLPIDTTLQDFNRFVEFFNGKLGDRCIVVTANIDITAIRQGHDT